MKRHSSDKGRLNIWFLKKFFFKILFILDRAEGRKKEREKTSMCGCLFCTPYWGPYLAHNPGMCPDWESNQRPFGLQAGTQSTEPHQPGINIWFFKKKTGSKCQPVICQPINDVTLHYTNVTINSPKDTVHHSFFLFRVMLTYRFDGLIFPHNIYTSKNLVLSVRAM